MNQDQSIPSDIAQTVDLFAYQLERGDLRQSTEIAIQCAKLFRLAALSAWEKDGVVSGNAAPSFAPVAAVTAISRRLLIANPTCASIEGIQMLTIRCIHRCKSKKEASAALGGLISKVRDSRTALVDNTVSVVACGPVERSVLILGSPPGGVVEKAVSEAAADMDALEVVIAAVSPHDSMAKEMAERLREEGSVSNVSVTNVVNLAAYLRSTRVHGCLLDGIAVDGSSSCSGHAIGWCGSAAVAAAARLAGIRVFVCAASYDILGEGTASLAALQDYNGHPGMVLSYEDVKRSRAELIVVNPVYDRLPPNLCDVLVTNDGSVAPAEVGVLLESCSS